jgi:hypothetical protein
MIQNPSANSHIDAYLIDIIEVDVCDMRAGKIRFSDFWAPPGHALKRA